METRILRVLHVAQDDKFFDSVYALWEKDKRTQNLAILIKDDKNYQPKWIKRGDVISILWNKNMVRDVLSSEVYDVIFFYSLPGRYWKLFKYIPLGKIVVWWAWGYELYSSSFGLEPFINLNIILHDSFQFTLLNKRPFVRRMGAFLEALFLKSYHKNNRKKMLRRIDYFMPVIPYEYLMMKKYPEFHATEFSLPSSHGSIPAPSIKERNGTILMGNSASITNNHIEVFRQIIKYKKIKQRIIVPLNYGDMKYQKWLIPQIGHPDVEILNHFMPYEEYMRLIDSCSFACFGIIRQQAMGNIFSALYKGLKLFLFKDSIVYKYLKSRGYIIFAIEDMDDKSLEIPLSADQQMINYNLYVRERERKNVLFEKCIAEITSKVDRTHGSET